MTHWTHTMTKAQHKELSDAMYNYEPGEMMGEADLHRCKSCGVPNMHSRSCSLTAGLDKTSTFEEGMAALERILHQNLDRLMWNIYNAQTGEDAGGNNKKILKSLKSLRLSDERKRAIADWITQQFVTTDQIRTRINKEIAESQPHLVHSQLETLRL